MNKVKPIKDREKLGEIQEALYRDQTQRGKRLFLLFMIGIYTGLRVSDIVKLRVENVTGSEIETREKKTGKTAILPVAAPLKAVIAERTKGMGAEEYVFPSRKKNPDGSGRHITTRSAYNDVQAIVDRFGLGKDIGCHSLRKTFGYHHYQQNHDIELLRMWFNHSSQTVTRRYICVETEEMRKSLYGFNMGWNVPQPSQKEKPEAKIETKPLEIERQERSGNGQRWKPNT